MQFFYHLGKYFILITKVFSKPEKGRIYYRQTLKELVSLGVNSIGIVIIISAFTGAVITLQTAYNPALTNISTHIKVYVLNIIIVQ